MCVNIRSNATKDVNIHYKKSMLHTHTHTIQFHAMRRNTWYNLYILHNIIHFICVPIYLRKSLLKRRSFLCVCAMPSLCGFLAFQLFHFDIAISIDGDGVCIFPLLHLYASKFSTIRFELSFQFFFLPSLWSASNGCLHCTYILLFVFALFRIEVPWCN